MSGSPAIAVFVVDLRASRAALEADERATPRLSAEDVARFHHKAQALGEDDARDWRVTHIALRIILERATGDALRGVAFDRAAGGRPRLPRSLGLTQYPEFSLAHAGAVAMIAISHHGTIGVDIEVPRDIRMPEERRARIIGAATRLAPRLRLPDDTDARLLQSWVRLEAIAKATGLGIGRILAEAGVVGGHKAGHENADLSYDVGVADLALGPDRFAALAAPHLPQNIDIQAFPVDAAALAAFKTLMPSN